MQIAQSGAEESSCGYRQRQMQGDLAHIDQLLVGDSDFDVEVKVIVLEAKLRVINKVSLPPSSYVWHKTLLTIVLLYMVLV